MGITSRIGYPAGTKDERETVTIEQLKAERSRIMDEVSSRINGRISERRKASGCAWIHADSQMWSSSDRKEFNDAMRPINRKIVKSGFVHPTSF